MNPRFTLELFGLSIVDTVIVTALLSVVLVAFAAVTTSRLRTEGMGLVQAALEAYYEWIAETIRQIVDDDPAPYVPLVGTLTLFIATANLIGLVPGLRPPTADLSTTVALSLVVFFAVPYFGIRQRGLVDYLRSYARPNPILLPLNLLGELTRTLALAIRLFGNAMSGQMIVAILIGVAGALVPVPLMILGILTSLVQAYIFGVLTAVYIGAAVRVDRDAAPTRGGEPPSPPAPASALAPSSSAPTRPFPSTPTSASLVAPQPGATP